MKKDMLRILFCRFDIGGGDILKKAGPRRLPRGAVVSSVSIGDFRALGFDMIELWDSLVTHFDVDRLRIYFRSLS